MATEREVIINETTEESIISPQEINKSLKMIMPVNKAKAKAQTYLSYIYEGDDEDSRSELYELLEDFLSQDQQSGDADDFHNFAVELARKDEYTLACKVLECGLNYYPKSVDLLSDYLQYGVNCNKVEECKRIYKTLIKIPRRRWTWRGFAFAVDYLQFLIERSDSDKEIDSKEKEILEIVADFRNCFPFSEESYRTEADVYKSLNMHKEELTVLKSALDNVLVAPKCSLRYADILFERGEYEEASKAIERCISDATQTQSSINEGYSYYLSALCKIAIIQKKEIEMTEKDVDAIYSDFNIALDKFRTTRNSYSDVIRTKTITIVNKTGIDVDPKYELLCECLAE